jgi:uncharacterized protein with NRDE domain
MCLIAFAWRAHRDYRFVLAANRDEYFRRPAAPAAFWDDHHFVLAGRDLEAGGTWLGITLQGKFAAITNYRNPAGHRTGSPSRGQLPSEYLAGSQPPHDYLGAVARQASQYNGFSLLVGDLDAMWFLSNRGGAATQVKPGVHALSNHLLDTPWPKVEKGKSLLAATLARPFDAEALLAAFDDTRTETAAALPETGVGPELEERLSAVRIAPVGGYGTRCSTVLAVGEDGRVELCERTWREDGRAGGTVRYRFTRAGGALRGPASSRGAGSRPRRTPLPAR